MTKMNNDRWNCMSWCRIAMVWGVALGSCMMAHAQGQGFRMGLALDPNVSWMNSRDFEHTTTGGRAHFGYQFMADIMFAETYAIGTGLNVFRTGSSITYWEPTNDTALTRVTRDFNNQYVELPLTFKLRTKEIGYTTYFGKFGGGVGLNTRREALESRARQYNLEGDEWTSVPGGNPEESELISGDFASLMRASMIIGLGFERRIAGSTAIMVGVTYNNSLFSTHKDQILVEADASGDPRISEDGPLTKEMEGHDSFISLTVGVVF